MKTGIDCTLGRAQDKVRSISGRNKHRWTIADIFWSFKLNQVRQGLATLKDLEVEAMAAVSGGGDGFTGDNGSGSGSSSEVIGYTGNSPPILVDSLTSVSLKQGWDVIPSLPKSQQRRRVMKKVQKKNFNNKSIITRAGNFLKNKKTLAVTSLVALIALFASCKEKKTSCNVELGKYNDSKTIAEKDSVATVNYYNNYEADATPLFKNILDNFMTDQGMTREQAWEAALCTVRDYPDHCDEATKNYVNVYMGLVNAFNKSKAIRADMYADLKECENSK